MESNRRKHLYECLRNAQESTDEQREKEILAIITREKDRSFWRRINYSMGKARGGSVRRILVESGDQVGRDPDQECHPGISSGGDI